MRKTRFLSILLSLVFGMSFFGACTSDKGNSNSDNSSTEQQSAIESSSKHVFNVSESSARFIVGGTSSYTVVYPENFDVMGMFALDELRTFTEKATGVYLTAQTDNGLTYSDTAKYVSLGDTTLLEQAGIAVDTDILNGDGYYIQSKGNSVFIIGDNSRGVLHGVYTFLKYQFNYAYYGDNAYQINSGVINNRLMWYDVKDIPDVHYRTAGYGEITYNATNTRRLRMYQNDEVIMPLCGQTIHNTFFVVPKNELTDVQKTDENGEPVVDDKGNPVYMTLEELHPNWYAPNGSQLCYTRDRDNLVDYVVEKMKAGCIEYPDLNIITFTQQDVTGWCNCDECRKVINKYNGAASATQVLFINQVSRKLTPWVEENFPGRKIILTIFAYFETLDAPAVLNENGKYEPIDKDVVLEPNVALYYAPYGAKNYYSLNSQENITHYNTIEKWKACASKFLIWLYGCHFADYFIPLDNITALQDTIQYLLTGNVQYFYIQSQWNTVASDWSRLKMYLQAQLAWDSSQDVNALIEQFFNGYFGPAGSVMLEYFHDYKAYSAYLATELGLSGTANLTNIYTSAEAWKLPVLLKWNDYCKKAYKKLELLKYSDPKQYQIYYDHIELEELSSVSLLYKFHQSYYSKSEYAALYEKFKLICNKYSVRFSE